MDDVIDSPGGQPPSDALADDDDAPRPPSQTFADGAFSPLTRTLQDVMRPVVWCRADDRIADVARQIGASDQSCALVRTPTGLGIVTDHDFRERVVGGDLSPDQPVELAVTTPALTIEPDATQTAGLLRMVEHGVHHLVVVDADEPVGIVRVVDLARTGMRDPLLVRTAIASADTLDKLAAANRLLPATVADLRATGVLATHVGAVQAAITDAVVRQALALGSAASPAGVRVSWVLLGSLARREPLPRSDVDTALIWADQVDPDPDPAEEIRSFARRILTDLRACGLMPCANGANADNPLFSRSQSAWASAAKSWMKDPTRDGALLLPAMVADSRPLTDMPLGLRLTESIRSHTRTSQFLRALLDEALAWRPPTGFVRDFIVEHSGEHRGELDLKRGGLAPVVALGRWIAIATNDSRGTTPERLHRGVATGLLTADEASVLVGGFEDIYALVLDHELAAVRSGLAPEPFVAPKDLDSLSRRQLRETLRAIARVQQRVDLDWIRRLTK